MARGPRNLRIAFGSTTLTHYGGVYLLHRFLTRIGFKRALGPARAAQQSLQCGRDASGSAVSYGARSRTDRDQSTTAPKRRVPVSDRTAKLSGCYQPAAVPAARRTESASKAARFARPLSSSIHGSSGAADASHLRRGLHRARGLWKTGASTHRLQPHQARAALLPSAALLRGPEPRLGTGNCGPATSIPPAAFWTFSKPASPRFLRA